MFGYIKAYKPEMKVKEFETYKTLYCSLCRELGKAYGIFARLTLNYDFVFLAIAAAGVNDGCPKYVNGRCAFNPLKKCGKAEGCEKELSFAAGVAMIMLYYKLLDNIADGNIFRKFGCTLVRPFAARARKKAMKKYPAVDEIISDLMQKQSEIEKDGNISVDLAAEPSSKGLSEILKMAADDEPTKNLYGHIGYCVGKWVYLVDALDDYDKDCKNGNFNPLKSKKDMSREQLEEWVLGIMNFCICEACDAFEKVQFKKFRPLLENVLYMGLPHVQEDIIKKERKKANDRPL